MPARVGNTTLALQRGLATAATRSPHKRFYRLSRLLGERGWLEAATDAVLDNDGSETPGVDGMRGSLLRDPICRAKFIDDLREKLHGNYKPSPVLRKYIPKASGGLRPIGIPTIRDRIVQMALKMVLEPIFEADFLPNSNGFRPGRSTLECVLPVYWYGNRSNRYGWVIEGDIKGCFDNIDHEFLMNVIRRRIADRKIPWLIWRFLKAHVVERGKRTKMEKGTPQGGVLSPLLANIYLNRFDQHWFRAQGRLTEYQRRRRLQQGLANCVLFRYADDFILIAKGARDGVESIVRDTKQYFSKHLKLELTEEKTRVVPLEQGFEFLGFKIQRARMGHFSCVRIRPTHRNVVRLVTKLNQMLGKQADADDPAIKITELNRILRGWANYYKTVNARQQFLFGDYVADRLYLSWYARKKHQAVKQTLAETKQNGRIVQTREKSRVELFKMSSLQSMNTPMNFHAIFRYRHIENPYLMGNHVTCIEEEEQPIGNVRDIHPIAHQYDETYLINRVKAFERDGWRCTIKGCGERVGLVAHHIKPVPVGKAFDPEWVHRVENLQTLCTQCHLKYAVSN
jgi:group II intron reverse transcriptase/maturase